MSQKTIIIYELTCNNCQYQWDYKGNHHENATCPKCGRKVRGEVK